jgi:ribonuclease HI
MRNAFDVLMRRGATVAAPKHPPLRPVSYVLMFDGGSRGNPGLCGAGAVILIEGMETWTASKVVSLNGTNNFAEYSALNIGLKELSKMGVERATVFGDSQLIINQMTGKASVRTPSLLPLFLEASSLVREIGDVDFQHVKRNMNKRADQLANIAMDDYLRSAEAQVDK